MSYQEFVEAIKVRIEERLQDGQFVMLQKTLKPNNQGGDSLVICDKAGGASPVCPLEEFYKVFLQHGGDLDYVTDLLLEFNISYKLDPVPDLPDLTKWEYVKDLLGARMINTGMNREYLENHVSVPFLDLSVIFYAGTEKSGHQIMAVITYDLLGLWEISTAELMKQAFANMYLYNKPKLQSMEEMIGCLMEKTDEEADLPEADGMRLYVLSNERMCFGAVWMCRPEVLHDAARQIGVKSCYILPSSVHECLIVPAGDGLELSYLKSMVRDINREVVSEAEFLSDSVYCYDEDTGSMMIAGR